MKSDNVNIYRITYTARAAFAAQALILVLTLAASAQLNPDVVPFAGLLEQKVELKRNNVGVHPRIFFDQDGLAKLRERAKGDGKDLWTETLSDIKTLKRSVPDPADPDLYKSGLDKKAGQYVAIQCCFSVEPICSGLRHRKGRTLSNCDKRVA